MPAIPRPVFGREPQPRYFSSIWGWIVWTAGPDEQYDLNVDEDLKRAIKSNIWPDEWICRKIYDVSNGSMSSGDIVWRKGM